MIKETEDFEQSLKDMEYIHGASTDLLKYAQGINCHFASKKCKDVIVVARKLMTSKMHNTIKVGYFRSSSSAPFPLECYCTFLLSIYTAVPKIFTTWI